MGRPASMLEGANPIVSSITYNVAGQITALTAPGHSESRTYNIRGQLTRQTGFGVDISYGFSATQNDGRIQTRTDHISGETVEYQYDQLGRLISAATQGAGGWGLAWNHDGFGNLTQQSVTKGQMTGFTLSINGATNRVNHQNYDANGNWLGMWGQAQTYDIDNRVHTASSTQHQETYLYSARNERIVSKRDQDRHRVHFYGADGLLLGIYTLEITQQNPSYTYPVRLAEQERVYFGGRLMQIGGESVATDRLGSVVRKGTTNYKYAPYGQEIGGATANDTVKFATYTRDSLSGLDYALNRYYKPEWGRFTSPDPYQASGGPADPGSWNRYTYVGGDPVNWYDPPGLDRWDPNTNTLYGDGSALGIALGGSGNGGSDKYEAQVDAGFGEIAEDTPGGLVPSQMETECSLAEFIMRECSYGGDDSVLAGSTLFRAAAGRALGLGYVGWHGITRFMGLQGEAAVRRSLGLSEAGRKSVLELGSRRFIPDIIDDTGRRIIEVKNASHVSFTGQIQTYLNFLMSNPKGYEGWTFHLYVNESAQLSSTIRTLHHLGIIHVHTFKWP